jgi:hypothetical protein
MIKSVSKKKEIYSLDCEVQCTQMKKILAESRSNHVYFKGVNLARFMPHQWLGALFAENSEHNVSRCQNSA